jgi:hypothetical protein
MTLLEDEDRDLAFPSSLALVASSSIDSSMASPMNVTAWIGALSFSRRACANTLPI